MSVGKIIEEIDLDKMFSSPFIASNQAQADMASSTIEFLQTFAFDQDESGNNTNYLKTFTINTYYDDPIDSSNGVVIQKNKQLTLPLLTLLNVPALQIQKVVLDLTIKIESQTSEKSNDSSSFDKEKSSSGKIGLFGSGAKTKTKTRVTASSSSSESRDSTTSAKYKVHIEAENKPPAGLAMIMDFMNRTDTAPNRSQIPNGQVL